MTDHTDLIRRLKEAADEAELRHQPYLAALLREAAKALGGE